MWYASKIGKLIDVGVGGPSLGPLVRVRVGTRSSWEAPPQVVDPPKAH